MSHIRSSPARPAPPLTTTTSSSSSSGPPSPGPSTASRAQTHLQRVHNESSDRASIRTTRSRGTSMSSSRTATPASVPEELELVRPEQAESGLVEQVVKRQKMEGSAPLTRKPSWFGKQKAVVVEPPSVLEYGNNTSGSEANEMPAAAEAPVDSTPAESSNFEIPAPSSSRPSSLVEGLVGGQRRSSWFGRGGRPEASTSRSVSAAATALPPLSEPVTPHPSEDPMPATTIAPPEHPSTTGTGGTLKAIPDDGTVTQPNSSPTISSVATPQRSWWGWGGVVQQGHPPPAPVAEEKVPAGISSSPTPDHASEMTSSVSSLAASSSTVSSIDPARPTRSWLQTLWGESHARPPPVPESPSGSEPPSVATEPPEAMPPPPLPPLPPPNPEPETTRPAPAAVSALRQKASWGFFPARRGSSSEANSSVDGVSGGPEPILVPRSQASAAAIKSNSLLSKSPLGGLGVGTPASSRASSLSARDPSAPPSPRLGPQADAPLKPLTGSIRSSRPGANEQDPPFENLVLPTFTDTFLRAPRSFPPRQSRITKAVSLVNAWVFSHPPPTRPDEPKIKEDPAEKLPKSLEVVGEPPRLAKIRRVVTIGVHGWFPSPMVRSITGEPTGTSVKFATMMHDAVQSYLESHDITTFNIYAIALEGEGQVDARVDKLFSQLTEREAWVEALKKADVVFLATHSQGSVVSTQLLARMIDTGLVQGPRTHLLAMCAIAQGPFVYLNQSYTLSPYFNYIESAAARELFEFQDPESAVSKKFLASLQAILSHGVKVTVVGSINDQVTPLYSSLFAGISHPSIVRAVYIDSAAFRTSDFLANLIVFASRLRNAGLRDHDLIYHVSEALAGALTGVGHSKIYEEDEVFNLAVRYQFETTTLAEAPTLLPRHLPEEPLSMSFSPRDRRNPYLLTWALRGIIEDPQVRELFSNELMALREAFETWRPTTKVLRDVRLKLEGIRMLPRVKKDGKL